MARVAVSIIALRYPAEATFPNEIIEVFEQMGAWNAQEDFTYTGRVNLDLGEAEFPARRDALIAAIRARLPGDEADRLIVLLEEHSWDVSFFVDCF